MGFGEAWRRVPCFCKHPRGKNATTAVREEIFPWAEAAVAGMLSLPRFTCSSTRLLPSAPTWASGRHSHSRDWLPLITACGGGALFSSLRILETQRPQVTCPSHTASEDQSGVSPRDDSKPSVFPVTLRPTKLSATNSTSKRKENEIFFFWGTSDSSLRLKFC